MLGLVLPSVTPSGGGWSGCNRPGDGYTWYNLGTVSAGGSRTMRLGFTATHDAAGQGIISVHSETENGVFPDSNPEDKGSASTSEQPDGGVMSSHLPTSRWKSLSRELYCPKRARIG